MSLYLKTGRKKGILRFVISTIKKKKKRKKRFQSSRYSAVEMNPTSIHGDVGSIPGLAQWVRDMVLL